MKDRHIFTHRFFGIIIQNQIFPHLQKPVIAGVKGNVNQGQLRILVQHKGGKFRFFQNSCKRQLRPHVRLPKEFRVLHLHPVGDDPGEGHAQINEGLRHLHHRVFHRLILPGQQPADSFLIGKGIHQSFVKLSLPSGPSGYLLDLRHRERTHVSAVKLFRFQKNHSPYGKIHPHPYGVGTDNDAALSLQKFTHFILTDRIGKRAVNHAGFYPVFLQLGCHRQNFFLGKDHKRIVFLHAARKLELAVLHPERNVSGMPHYLPGIAAHINQLFYHLLCVR